MSVGARIYKNSLNVVPGYVGGSLLQRLLSHPKASTFAITTLVRNAEKAKAIAAILPDVNVVTQHPGKYDQFESLSEQSHIVMHVVSRRNLARFSSLTKPYT